jgi:hypothetical protein
MALNKDRSYGSTPLKMLLLGLFLIGLQAQSGRLDRAAHFALLFGADCLLATYFAQQRSLGSRRRSPPELA